ncbi:MAG TPA: phosphatase PAP2 family protein [Candidatus Kapabacteria bacterium]|nr:phosphatase PAP2 family protein [Candidatus Kapabacteria bacterium]
MPFERTRRAAIVMLFSAALPMRAHTQPFEKVVPAIARDAAFTNGNAYSIDDPWVTGSVILAGGVGGFWWVFDHKPDLTDSELRAINPDHVPIFDRISLHQNVALVHRWMNYAHIGQGIGASMPVLLLLDPAIRRNWFDILTYALEADMAELAFYTLSPLGPRWVTRYRPLVYYADDSGCEINRREGYNKASFYSGHVASFATTAFFMATVYSDYRPAASKTLLYTCAALPTLAMGFIRFMTLDHFPSDILAGCVIGTAFGLLMPHLHKIPP